MQFFIICLYVCIVIHTCNGAQETNGGESDLVSYIKYTTENAMNIDYSKYNTLFNKINIITQFNPRRNVQGQIAAITHNLYSPFVKKIFISLKLSEYLASMRSALYFEHEFIVSEKIVLLKNFMDVISLKDAIDISNSMINSTDELTLVMNSDIALDHSTIHRFGSLFDSQFLYTWFFVTRRYTYVPESFGYFDENKDLCLDFSGSADCFAFRGPISYGNNNEYLNLKLGTRNMESKLAYEISEMGYAVNNPCYFINLLHYHYEFAENRKQTRKVDVENNKYNPKKFKHVCQPRKEGLRADYSCYPSNTTLFKKSNLIFH